MQGQQEALDKIRTLQQLLSHDLLTQDMERELDIVRGRVPTPPGYRVDTTRIKRYMRRLS